MSLAKKTLLLFTDIFAFYLSLILTILIRYKFYHLKERLTEHLLPFSFLLIFWLIIFFLVDLYHQKSLKDKKILFKNLLTAIFISALLSLIFFYLFQPIFSLTPKTNLLIFSLFLLIFDFGFRNYLAKIFKISALNISIIGDSPLISETISYINQNPQLGYKIVNLDENPQLIIVHPKFLEEKERTQSFYQFIYQGIDVINFWDFYENLFSKVPLDELKENWFIENIALRRPIYDFLKRLFDLILSFLCLLIFFPLALIIAFLIKITSKGPVIYQQKRVGKNNKIFILYKFRTMIQEAEKEGPKWAERNDKRTTSIGKILRNTHLDEIPQLINILKGDLSFTGPRPERPEFVEKLKKEIPFFDVRHLIKPGLTGWAQINYRATTNLEEAKEKLCYDIYYVKNRSLFLDLLITIKTIRHLFTNPE